jgi:hypothetical protein
LLFISSHPHHATIVILLMARMASSTPDYLEFGLCSIEVETSRLCAGVLHEVNDTSFPILIFAQAALEAHRI